MKQVEDSKTGHDRILSEIRREIRDLEQQSKENDEHKETLNQSIARSASDRQAAQDKQAEQKSRIRNDLEQYGRKILNSDEMQQAFRQTHHTRSTVGEHTQRVAEKSLAICYALNRLHIHTDIPAVVTGALCHDLGMLSRDEKYASNQECYRQHSSDSVDVAKKLVDDLPKKTPDIIERHMWPSAKSKTPNSLEGMVVSVADKAAALEDFIQGSKVKHIGLKETIQNIRERSYHRGS